MSWFQVHRRRTAWIALLAILAATLMPTLAQAVAASQGSAWVEVCTVGGSRWVNAAAPGEALPSDDAPASAHAFDQCPYCHLHLNGFVPLAAAPVDALGLDLSHALPRAFLEAPHTLHAWASAQPRGPPAC